MSTSAGDRCAGEAPRRRAAASSERVEALLLPANPDDLRQYHSISRMMQNAILRVYEVNRISCQPLRTLNAAEWKKSNFRRRTRGASSSSPRPDRIWHTAFRYGLASPIGFATGSTPDDTRGGAP